MALPHEYELRIVTPSATVFRGATRSLCAPGAEGYLGVLPGHYPLITSLKPGKLTFTSAAGVEYTFEVGAGYMEVMPASVTIITESVTRVGGGEVGESGDVELGDVGEAASEGQT